jgi:hypothetical protein
MKFVKIMLQYIVLPLNRKRRIPVKFNGSYCTSSVGMTDLESLQVVYCLYLLTVQPICFI